MNVNELINQLTEIREYLIWIEQLAPEAKTGDGAVMLHAIEAIKVLVRISNMEGAGFDEADWQDHAQWCQQVAKDWINSLETK